MPDMRRQVCWGLDPGHARGTIRFLGLINVSFALYTVVSTRHRRAWRAPGCRRLGPDRGSGKRARFWISAMPMAQNHVLAFTYIRRSNGSWVRGGAGVGHGRISGFRCLGGSGGLDVGVGVGVGVGAPRAAPLPPPPHRRVAPEVVACWLVGVEERETAE